MNPSIIPDAHQDPWLNIMRGYVSAAVRALATGGLRPEASWLDPKDPRDATILLTEDGAHAARALVWDEETGWRTGAYVSGEPGKRTALAEPVYLGGGVLVDPGELTARLREGISSPRQVHRSRHDLRDGLDDLLRTY